MLMFSTYVCKNVSAVLCRDYSQDNIDKSKLYITVTVFFFAKPVFGKNDLVLLADIDTLNDLFL